MSASDLLTDDDLKTDRATEPPKRWRNLYQTVCARRSVETGLIDEAGTVGWGRQIWPSKDIAESKRSRDPLSRWLGAFPDGEAP